MLSGTSSKKEVRFHIMAQAEQIRRLAGRNVGPEAIARRLKVKLAVVRRVLSRSPRRGPPRTRAVSETLSFGTTAEVAAQVRAEAMRRGVSISALLDQMVRGTLATLTLETPGTEQVTENGATDPERSPIRVRPPETAAGAPIFVRRLLKSYDLDEVRWSRKNDRHAVVVAILTRGDAQAKRWLWSVLPRAEVRELVREYQGAGCAEPDRALLRKQLALTETDIPKRPYLGMGTEFGRERPDSR